MLNEFFKNVDAKNDEELERELQKFMLQYNAGMIEYEETDLDKAYELLNKAENAKTKRQAIKLANEAYELCSACLDAKLFLADIEENTLKREKILDEALAFEKERLEKEGFFDKDNIGHFYGIFETRAYIRGLNMQAYNYASDGKMHKAKDVCREILRLNTNDNMGSRYLLMAIYAYFEEEKELLALYNKYKENNLSMLFPLLAFYYKLGDYDKAKKYLKEINAVNPHFYKFFKGTLKINDKVPTGYYSIGDASEVLMYFDDYFFLLLATPNLPEFILENLKKK